MDKELYITHPTTLEQMDCRLKHHWGRNYKPRSEAPALTFGLAIHEALATYYGDKGDPYSVFKKYMNEHSIEVPGYEESGIGLGIDMLTNYFREYQGKERFQVISVEEEAARRVPIPEDDIHPPSWSKNFYLGARIDAIVYDKNLQKAFVLEHKTFSDFFPAYLELSHQFSAEKFVAEGILRSSKYRLRSTNIKYRSIEIAGVIYNGLRKARKPTRTTNLFERHYVYLNENQIKVMLHHVYWKLMETSSRFYPIFPEPTSIACRYCNFKQVCLEYQRGGDYQFMLDNLYIKREEGEEDEWV